MNQRQIESVIYTARLGSSSKAAAELYTTQPTVTYQISALESELGLELFERDGRGMRLTPDGRELLPELEKALENMRAIEEAAKNLRQANKLLTVMHFQHIHDPLFKDALKDFRTTHPQVGIRFLSPIVTDVFSFPDADVWMLPPMRNDAWYPAGTRKDVLFRTWTYGMVSERFPLASRRSMTVEDLAGRTVIFLARPIMERLEAWYIAPIQQMELEGRLTIEYADERTLDSIQYRIMGDERTVYISQGTYLSLARDLRLIPFSDAAALPVYACWNDRKSGAGIVREFVHFLVDYYARHGDAFAQDASATVSSMP